MHEFSIVQSLLGIIEGEVRKNNAKKVTKVVLSIGVLSGVEPHLLKVAFETFKEGTPAEDSELIIEIEPLKLKCKECGEESVKEELNLQCPRCGSLNTQVTGGEEMLLKSLELEVE